MLDLNSSPLLWEASLAERRREVAALRRSNHASRAQLHLRAGLANILAHIAFHIDQRAVGVIIARHPNTAGH